MAGLARWDSTNQAFSLCTAVFAAMLVSSVLLSPARLQAQESPPSPQISSQEGGWQASVTLEAADPLKATIQQMLQDPTPLPLMVRQRIKALGDYYNDPTSRVLWQDEQLADSFLHRLENARFDGLGDRTNLFEQLQNIQRVNRFALSRQADLRQVAEAELYWSAGFLKYAQDLKKGRFLPTKMDSKLYWHPKEVDMTAALQLLAALGQVDQFFDQWEPQIPTYKALKIALADYLVLQSKGGWPTVKAVDLMKPGETNADVVPSLRSRLAVTDGAKLAASPDADAVFDEDLVKALKRFQVRHGLDADGVLGKKTLFQLNIPIDARIRQIELFMERLRWMPEDLGPHYIQVNIAGFELKNVKNGTLVDLMRVVVGKPYHQTPVFSKRMTYVELNPYWNVPRSIAINEELAHLQQAAGARAAKGFEALINDKPVPVTSINWSQYSKSNFPFRLRQKPGDGNALGRVKFMFPNQFNVYMHDTPARSLFSQADRAFSHGCIRLARPVDLAVEVLSQVPGWTRERIDAVLASKKNTTVSLKEPIDVHIIYSTAWRDPDGDVQFRADIYRRDVKLYSALFGKPYPY